MSQDKSGKQNFINSSYNQNKLTKMIQILAEISDKLATVFDFDEFVEKAVRLTQQALKYDQVVLHLLRSDQQKFTLKIVANANHGQVIHSYPSSHKMSLAYLAIQENRIIQIDDLAAEAPSYYKSRALDILSELHIPLERGNRMIGVLSFGSINRGVFKDDIVLILQTFAAQVTILIEKIRRRSNIPSESTYQSSGRLLSRSQLSQEYNIQTIIPSLQSLAKISEVFNRIVEGVVDGLGYEGAMVSVLDEENLTLPVQAFAFSKRLDRLNLLEWTEGKLGFKVIGTSASLINDPGNLGVQSCISGEPKITNDLYELIQPAVGKTMSDLLQKHSDIKTCISIPLLVKNRVVGNLYAATKKEEILEHDLNNLLMFVTNAAIAVQNAMLFEQVNQELESRKAELTQLRGIENVISSSLDLHEVLKRILNGALELTKAEHGQVVLAGKYASDLVRRVSYPQDLDVTAENKFGITQLIMREKKAKLIDNAELLARENEKLKSLAAGTYNPYSKMKSHLGVPILLGDELIGIINIASQEVGAFNRQSLNMLEQLAVQAAIAITNAYRFKEQQETEKRLANANQVAAMGDISSNMVHSINNWIGSIRADAIYLIDQYKQGQINQNESLDILDDILRNAKKTLSKAEKIRQPFQLWIQEPIDVNECILTTLQENQEELSNLQLVIKDFHDLPPVMATQQLEQVFDNLIKNAVQAMNNQNGGVLRLVTRCSTDGQNIEIIVKDSGPGLPDSIDEIEIFKLGKTSRPSGMGYGLWWCDTYLKRIEGDIQLVENTSTGCKFLIKLPI